MSESFPEDSLQESAELLALYEELDAKQEIYYLVELPEDVASANPGVLSHWEIAKLVDTDVDFNGFASEDDDVTQEPGMPKV